MNRTGLIARLAEGTDPLARMLLQDAAGGVLVLDVDGNIRAANDLARRHLGASGLPDDVADRLRDMARGAPTNRLDWASASAEPDQERALAIFPMPLIETDGVRAGLLLRLVDLSVERRLEARLAHGQKLQAVGQLAGGIAHDFNNLLAAITTTAELMRDRADADAALREDAAAILAAAGRGAALVRQLLAFGRRQTLQPRVLPINGAIRALAGLLRRVLGGAITLELELGEEDLLACVDPTQLDQVLLNLAVNAAAAMPDGGTLSLHSGHVTLFRPLARAAETIPPGRYVMVEVRDTGLGIAPDILPRIFEPFFSTRREAGGTGLGLATVHGIVRQSGGFVSVDSAPGQGAAFRIYLPRKDLPPAGAPRTDPPVGQPPEATAITPGQTVLLVDDEDAVRLVAARALRRAGWQVIAHPSGDSALGWLREPGRNPPAAVISDVLMPGIDGPALVRAARALHPGLPALLVSGYSDERLRSLLGEGNTVFLSKPYTLAALTASLRCLLSSQAAKAMPAD